MLKCRQSEPSAARSSTDDERVSRMRAKNELNKIGLEPCSRGQKKIDKYHYGKCTWYFIEVSYNIVMIS